MQYLGRMPWVSRATAIKPDKADVARGRAKVKLPRVPTFVDLLSDLHDLDRSRSATRRAISADAPSGIGNTELTLISPSM